MASLETSRVSETLDLLMHPYRRYVLYYLRAEQRAANVDTLVSVVGEWDGDERGTGRGHERGRIEIALRHTHLPKLAEADVIAFDENWDAVELEETDGIDPFLGTTERMESN